MIDLRSASLQKNMLRENLGKLFITDCEGPISRNDNAYELAEHFLPEGAKLFTLISRYDDVQADIIKRQGYTAGSTLKLILPFLKAYGASNESIMRFSTENLLLMPGAPSTLRFVQGILPSFIVSTSFEQYMQALCKLVGFPYKNVYCTQLNIDEYPLSLEETRELKKLSGEIVDLPMLRIPNGASSINSFSMRDQATIQRLDEIFWEDISSMECGSILEAVNPIGGPEKADAIRDIQRTTRVNLFNALYIGDSITDVDSLRLVRASHGLAVAFNGNKYAIREAEIAVLSEDTIVVSIIADVFHRLGKERVIRLAEEWSYPVIQDLCKPLLQSHPSALDSSALPKVEIVTSSNREQLTEESIAFRKLVRGKSIGELG